MPNISMWLNWKQMKLEKSLSKTSFEPWLAWIALQLAWIALWLAWIAPWLAWIALWLA